MINLFDKIDFFFDNLSNHHAAILFLFVVMCVYLMHRSLKEIKACNDEPEIEEDEN